MAYQAKSYDLTVLRSQGHRHKPMVVTVTVVSPFEEEEEGTGIVSDVVKVKGEDPATPGPLT